MAQEPLSKRPLLLRRGRVKERFLVNNHDWLVPLQSLRRLSSTTNHPENELESVVFPADDVFDSHWQLYVEHQSSSPARIRLGLALLAPRNKCLRADVKLIILTTHGGQIIKEHLFQNHIFFLAQGEAISSCINDHISPKICLDIDEELYQDVVNGTQQGNLFNTDDCTIVAYVRLINELQIEPKSKTYDFSRRFTVDWKLTKFHHIIEQINQSRPPVGNDRRLVSNRFQFTHAKTLDNLTTNKWKVTIHHPGTSSTHKHPPLNLILKSSNATHPNYGKFEIVCKNEHHILRRFIESMEDLTDRYTVEFFPLNELSANVYHYKQTSHEHRPQPITVDYLLLTIQIIQPLQLSEMFKRMRKTVEPTIISLNNMNKIRRGKNENASKSQRTESVVAANPKMKSPVSHENTTTSSGDDPRTTNPVFPPIRVLNNASPTRLRSSSSLKTLPNLGEQLRRSSRTFLQKPTRTKKQSSTVPSASTRTSSDLTENFNFLLNLFRSGLHSDIIIRYRERQWNLHKSILSARSIYFNQCFLNSKASELNLTDDDSDDTSPIILDQMFLFLYTNQYTLEKFSRLSSFDTTRLLFQASNKYGIDTLTLLCLQEMSNTQNLNINTSATLLIALHQAVTHPSEKSHSTDYLTQIKTLKQNILKFIQLHSREVLLSTQWKLLEKQYPFLVHDVLEFVVFE